MLTPSPPPVDNRRLTTRIATAELIRLLVATVSNQGGDMFQYLVFTMIWSANTEHLTAPDRYAGLHDIPPDSQRRPVSQASIRETLGAPAEIIDGYVETLIASGAVERRSGGLVVPTAVFTHPSHLANANELYARVVGMVARLREAGFRFGDAD